MLMIYEKEIRPDCITRVTQYFNYKKKKEPSYVRFNMEYR